MIKATHYSEAEGCKRKEFPFDFSKNEIREKRFPTYDNAEYSEALGTWVFSKVLLINTVKCCSIHFEDGSIYNANIDKFIYQQTTPQP